MSDKVEEIKKILDELFRSRLGELPPEAIYYSRRSKKWKFRAVS